MRLATCAPVVLYNRLVLDLFYILFLARIWGQTDTNICDGFSYVIVRGHVCHFVAMRSRFLPPARSAYECTFFAREDTADIAILDSWACRDAWLEKKSRRLFKWRLFISDFYLVRHVFRESGFSRFHFFLLSFCFFSFFFVRPPQTKSSCDFFTTQSGIIRIQFRFLFFFTLPIRKLHSKSNGVLQFLFFRSRWFIIVISATNLQTFYSDFDPREEFFQFPILFLVRFFFLLFFWIIDLGAPSQARKITSLGRVVIKRAPFLIRFDT